MKLIKMIKKPNTSEFKKILLLIMIICLLGGVYTI